MILVFPKKPMIFFFFEILNISYLDRDMGYSSKNRDFLGENRAEGHPTHMSMTQKYYVNWRFWLKIWSWYFTWFFNEKILSQNKKVYSSKSKFQSVIHHVSCWFYSFIHHTTTRIGTKNWFHNTKNLFLFGTISNSSFSFHWLNIKAKA